MKWETKYTLESKRIGLGVLYGYNYGWTRIDEDRVRVEFASYGQLLNYLSKYNEKDLRANSKIPLRINSFLRHVISGTETGDSEVKYALIWDAAGRNVYSERFKQDVLNWRFNAEMEDTRIAAWQSQFEETAEHPKGVPVPRTGVTRYQHRRSHKQGLSNVSILRESCAFEGWLRGKRASIPDWYYIDDGCGKLRSWKDTTKNPKQWMRGVRNSSPSRGKGTYRDDGFVTRLQAGYELELEQIQREYEQTLEDFEVMSA